MQDLLEKKFHLTKHGTNVRTECIAGLTSFTTMAYILVVNPTILSGCGMSFNRVFTGTVIASVIAMFVMGLSANLPFGLSAGMGLNAFFSYTVCVHMGYSWEWALSAVFVEGVIFLLLTFFNLREAIVQCIPAGLKHAIGAGIGLFIAYIGLKNAGIIVADPSGSVSVLSEDWLKGSAAVAVIGLLIMTALTIFKVKGALFIGIILTTLIGIPFGVTSYAGGKFLPSAPYFFHFAFEDIFESGKSALDFVLIIFTFLFVDMFDTVGTLIACAGKSGIIREDGSIPRCKQALFADAVGTTAGAIFGTSTVTTFVESAAGVAEGGRTGLTAIVTALLFAAALFLQPLFGSIPSAATAPALIVVGFMMISPIRKIDFEDVTEGLPAFLTVVMMVVSSSISDGIMFGILSYVFTKLVARRFKDLNPPILIVALLFILKILINLFV